MGGYTPDELPEGGSLTGSITPGFSTGSYSYLRPGVLVFENASSLWITASQSVSAYNVMQFTSDADGDWARAETISLDTVNGIWSIAGRNEVGAGGAFILYAASKAAVWRYNTVSRTIMMLYVARPGEYLRGVAFAPSAVAWRTPSALPTAVSSTTTPTRTALATSSTTATATLPVGASASTTPGASNVNRFQRSDTILILRAGDGTWYKEGSYMPLAWDEYSVPYARAYPGQQLLLQSLALPSGPDDPATGQYRCTLPRQPWGEGLPSLSAAGLHAYVPCYARERSSFGDSTDLKVIAIMNRLGIIDTSTRLTDAYATPSDVNEFTQVASPDNSRFWISGVSIASSVEAGVRLVQARGAATSGQVVAAYDSRGISIFNNTLFVALGGANASGIWQLGVRGRPVSGLPNQAFTPLNSTRDDFALLSIRSFWFESANRLWVASDHSPTTVQLQLFTAATAVAFASQGNWLNRSSVLLDSSGQAVYSVTGRSETSGGTTVYAVYAATVSTVFRVVNASGSISAAVIATAPSQTFFRGVVIPPYDPAAPAPSSSATLSLSPSNSPTSARTGSATGTGTPAITVSQSVLATPSNKPSSAATSNETSSRSASNTRSATASNTASVSAVPPPANIACAATIGSKVSVGDAHACAVSDCGAVTCTGANDAGQTDVPLAAQCGIRTLGAGLGFTCALSHAGAVTCWGGSNERGQLSVPATLQPTSSGGGNASVLAVGREHACVVTIAGGVACWGANAAGQRSVPPFLEAPAVGEAAVVSVTAGAAHTCALRSNGTVVCWGAPPGATVPAAGLTGVVSIAAGANHTCVVRTAGAPLCWGANASGQAWVPPLVAARDVVSVAPGVNHTCFLRANGSAVCSGWWPFSLDFPDDFARQPHANTLIALASGPVASTVCGVNRLGSLLCFGRNEWGQAELSSLQVDPACERPELSPACTPLALSSTPSISTSASATGTVTSSATQSGTGSWTATTTTTSSLTLGASSSVTASATVTATATATGSQTGTPSSTATATATGSQTGTPSSTATATVTGSQTGTPSSSATATATGSQTGTPSLTATATATGSQTDTPSSTATATVTATGSQTGTLSSSATVTATRSQTGTPSSSATATATGSQTGTPSSSATVTATGSQTGSPSSTATATATGSQTGTPSSTATATATGSQTDTPSLTATATATGSQTGTPSSSATATVTATGSQTGTPSSSATATATGSQTGTPSSSATATATGSQTDTPSLTATATATGSQTGTPSSSATATVTATGSQTGTLSSSATVTATGSQTGTPSSSATVTASGSQTGSPSSTATATATGSQTGTPSSSATATATGSQTGTPSLSATATATGSQTGTPSSTATVTATSSQTGSPSSSATVSRSCTPSVTGTPSSSATRTPTPSPSETRSATGSSSATRSGTGSSSGTRTLSGTGSGSQTGTGSSSETRSATGSPSGTRTPLSTRTATPTPPICRGLANVRALSGAVGSTPARSTDAAGCPGMYTSGSCTAGFKSFYPGARLVYLWALNETTPLGGTLRLSTCGLTADNTVLYVGTGCPTWALPFGCLVGNDDAAPPCGSNSLASTLSLIVTQRTYFFQVGGAYGRNVTAGLQWAYRPPPAVTSATGSRSRSASRTRSRTATKTRSRTASRSRSRKPK